MDESGAQRGVVGVVVDEECEECGEVAAVVRYHVFRLVHKPAHDKFSFFRLGFRRLPLARVRACGGGGGEFRWGRQV